MKSKIHILHTQVEGSRYLDDIPYAIWYVDNDKTYFTTLQFDTMQFDFLMELSVEKKYDFLRKGIEKGRERSKIWEIEIDSFNESVMDNEKELQRTLIKAYRDYKLNQII